MEGVGPAYVPGSAAAGAGNRAALPQRDEGGAPGDTSSPGGRVPGSAENRCSNTVSRVKAPGSAVRTAERAETTRRASADRQPEATGAAHRGRHSVSNARSPGKTPRPDGRRAQGAGARPRPAGPRPRERPRGQVAEAPGGGGGGTGGDHVLVRGTPGAMR